MSDMHTMIYSMNHIFKSETQHSKYVERVVFAMHKALIVSAKSGVMEVRPCSICSWNCEIRYQPLQDFQEIRHDLEWQTPELTPDFDFTTYEKTRRRTYSSHKRLERRTSCIKNLRVHSFTLYFWSMMLLLIPRTLDITI